MLPTEPKLASPTVSWRRVTILLTTFDLFALVLALLFAYILRYGLGWSLSDRTEKVDPLVPILCLTIWMITYRVFSLYSVRQVGVGLSEYRAIAMSSTFALAAVVIFDYIDQQLPISRAFLLLFWLASIVLVDAGRFIARRLVWRWSQMGGWVRRVLVIGVNEQAVQIAQELARNPTSCSVVLGFLSEYAPIGQSVSGRLKILADPMNLYEVAKRMGATHAVVVESALSWESMRYIIRSMHTSRSVEVLLAPGMFNVSATPVQFTQVGRFVLLMPHSSRIVGVEAMLKRVLDLALAVPACLITLPLQAAIWIYLKASGVGKPLKVIRGLGFGGKPMDIPRLAGGPRLLSSHLSRLPSLWLIVSGNMSIIGPRPLIDGETGPYESWLDVLTTLKPGFIGPWWLSGQGRPRRIEDEVEADLHYARHYTIWMDLRILLAVAPALLTSWRAMDFVGERPESLPQVGEED